MKYIVECVIKDEDGLDNDYIVVEADSEEDAKNIAEQDNWNIEEILDIYQK